MKTVATITAATMAFAISPAAAQSIVDTPHGPRIELRAGWDRTDFVVEQHDTAGRAETSIGESGVTYGGELGYDFAYGPSIMGLYAGISGSTGRECNQLSIGMTPIARNCIGSARDITVGARVGYVTAPNSLVYLKAGYSNGRYTYRNDDLLDLTESERTAGNLDGFHLGAGGEVGIGSHAYGKLEYVYTNYFGDEQTTNNVRNEIGLERHQLVAGIGYRF
jgi:outer membrane immunogenic protein